MSKHSFEDEETFFGRSIFQRSIRSHAAHIFLCPVLTVIAVHQTHRELMRHGLMSYDPAETTFRGRLASSAHEPSKFGHDIINFVDGIGAQMTSFKQKLESGGNLDHAAEKKEKYSTGVYARILRSYSRVRRRIKDAYVCLHSTLVVSLEYTFGIDIMITRKIYRANLLSGFYTNYWYLSSLFVARLVRKYATTMVSNHIRHMVSSYNVGFGVDALAGFIVTAVHAALHYASDSRRELLAETAALPSSLMKKLDHHTFSTFSLVQLLEQRDEHIDVDECLREKKRSRSYYQQALVRGAVISALAHGLQHAAFVLSREIIFRIARSTLLNKTPRTHYGQLLLILATSNCFAGAISLVIPHALDTVRRRYRMNLLLCRTDSKRYNSYWHCLLSVYNEGGVLSFWDGFPLAVLTTAIHMSVSLIGQRFLDYFLR